MNVAIHGREAIGELLQKGFPDNTAVISFYNPPKKSWIYDPPVDYSAKTSRVFQIAINDIDIDSLGDYGLTYETYFTEAEELAEFIYAAKADGLDIICQCEYGQSRSAGCAAAILEHFCKAGISVFADYRYCPNQLIFHKVFDALEAYKLEKGVYDKMDVVKELSLLESAGVTVIAARPGMGKTSLAVSIAQHCVLQEQVSIAFFSLELSEKQLAEKLNLTQSNLFIDDTAGITVSEIHKKCRELKDNGDLGLIVIDYFQLLGGEKAEEKAEGLKELSLDLGVPVVVISQLSRSCENHRPCLTTAFGESNVLADISDNVIFLYREESGECELIIAKSKN